MKLTCGAIIYNNESILIVQEAKNNRGKWNLPGGHIESGETPKDAVLREIKEELFLDLEILEDPIIYKTENAIIHIFYLKYNGGEILIQDELMDYKWVSKLEFEKIPDEQLRRILLKDIIDDFYKSRKNEFNT